MNHKPWLIAGALLTAIGAGAFLALFWGIFSSFRAMENAESLGIAGVAGGISSALGASIIGLIAFSLGAVVLIIGFGKYNRLKQFANR